MLILNFGVDFMKELTKVLTIEDGHKMFTYTFIPENKPKAIVQIVHGLDEHAGRYKELARKLTDNDFWYAQTTIEDLEEAL